jgi:hypothetical protein
MTPFAMRKGFILSRLVVCHMTSTIHYNEIFNAIIVSHTIDVMDDFIFVERAF